jgi:hypothetical protein
MDEFIKYWFQKCSLKLAALQVAAQRLDLLCRH